MSVKKMKEHARFVEGTRLFRCQEFVRHRDAVEIHSERLQQTKRKKVNKVRYQTIRIYCELLCLLCATHFSPLFLNLPSSLLSSLSSSFSPLSSDSCSALHITLPLQLSTSLKNKMKQINILAHFVYTQTYQQHNCQQERNPYTWVHALVAPVFHYYVVG